MNATLSAAYGHLWASGCKQTLIRGRVVVSALHFPGWAHCSYFAVINSDFPAATVFLVCRAYSPLFGIPWLLQFFQSVVLIFNGL